MRTNKNSTRLFAIISIIVSISLLGCSSDMPYNVNETNANDAFMSGHVNTYSRPELIKVANNFFGTHTTRSAVETPKIEPIQRKVGTRATELESDTIAYVLNYSENNSFVVIANDKRVPSVLAYSDENLFDQNDSIIQQEFIDNIPEFMERSIANKHDSIPYSSLPISEVVEPILTTTIYGQAPFNKYAKPNILDDQSHVTAVAGVYVLSHTKDTVVYNNETYYFKRINAGLNSEENSTEWLYATDKVAKLIADFADVLGYFGGSDDNFGFYYSSNLESLMQLLIEEFDCSNIPYLNFTPFDDVTAYEHLKKRYILITESEEENKWIIDGHEVVTRAVNVAGDMSSLEYFHCKWCNKNVNDGYYLFSRDTDNSFKLLKPTQYFRAKIHQ